MTCGVRAGPPDTLLVDLITGEIDDTEAAIHELVDEGVHASTLLPGHRSTYPSATIGP
jgi:hypothetical protein